MELVKRIDPVRNGHRPFGFESLHGQKHEFEHRIITWENGSGFLTRV